jgi:transcriptional regulator with XRE-family HTH domain
VHFAHAVVSLAVVRLLPFENRRPLEPDAAFVVASWPRRLDKKPPVCEVGRRHKIVRHFCKILQAHRAFKDAPTKPPAPPAGRDDGLPDIGRIVGALRRRQGYSLEKAAELSKLSPSFLSAVERGKSDISLRRLARLAALYSLDVASLLQYELRQPVPQFFPAESRVSIDRGDDIDYRRLRLPGIEFEWITVTLKAGSAFRDTLAHPGFDIVHVPFGDVVVVYGGVEYTMRAGDTGVWPGNVPHSFRNDTDSPASFVAAVTQTVWGSEGSVGTQPDERRESE